MPRRRVELVPPHHRRPAPPAEQEAVALVVPEAPPELNGDHAGHGDGPRLLLLPRGQHELAGDPLELLVDRHLPTLEVDPVGCSSEDLSRPVDR